MSWHRLVIFILVWGRVVVAEFMEEVFKHLSIPIVMIVIVDWLRSSLRLDVLIALQLLEGMSGENRTSSVVQIGLRGRSLKVSTLSLCCQSRVDVKTVNHLALHVVNTRNRSLWRTVVCKIRLFGVNQGVTVATELIVTSTAP
jgi:hypothetical protein